MDIFSNGEYQKPILECKFIAHIKEDVEKKTVIDAHKESEEKIMFELNLWKIYTRQGRR